MRYLSLAFALLLSTAASAQDMRPGLASIAVVSAEPEGRYGLDGDVVKPAKLKRSLVALDEQMAIGYVHLRKGAADITQEQLAEIRALAAQLGARLMVEKDGRLEPDATTALPTGQ